MHPDFRHVKKWGNEHLRIDFEVGDHSPLTLSMADITNQS